MEEAVKDGVRGAPVQRCHVTDDMVALNEARWRPSQKLADRDIGSTHLAMESGAVHAKATVRDSLLCLR